VDDLQVDRWLRILSDRFSRRGLGGHALGVLAAFGLAAGASHNDAAAKKKKKKKGKRATASATAPAPPPAAVCTPNCSNKTCGFDGCSGQCGVCDNGFACSDPGNGGVCLCPQGRQICNFETACCASGEECVEGTTCCRNNAVCNAGSRCCRDDASCLDDDCCFNLDICNGHCCGTDQFCIANECCQRARVCGSTCCSPGEACCNDECIPVDDDPLNCGNCEATCDQNQTCVAGGCLADGQYRVVLRWDRQPRDLDAHLWLPEGGTHAHITRLNPGDAAAFPFATHGGDIEAGFGPETIAIFQLQPGSTRFAVHLFAGSGTIGTSGATVDLYEGSAGNTPVRTFTAPASVDWDTADGEFVWWHVFDISKSGSDVAIVDVNEPSTDPAPYPDEAGLAFRLANGKGKADPYRRSTAQAAVASDEQRVEGENRDRSHTGRPHYHRHGKQRRTHKRRASG
jgi:hypothetical protein